VEELAAALNLSQSGGLALVAEAVELCYRLPRLWALVQSGRLQAWRARRVAKATPGLSPGGGRVRGPAPGRHRPVEPVAGVEPGAARGPAGGDPDQAAAVEKNALEHRGVWLDHRECTVTTLVTTRMDTLDALDLDQAVTALAGLLGRRGDHRDLDVRRACALGMLAHPQRAPGRGPRNHRHERAEVTTVVR
jgi:hypothetical protein